MLEYLEDFTPISYFFGVIGLLVGYYSIRVMSGTGGFAVGETGYHLGLIWKILIPIACGIGGMVISNKILGD